MIGNTLHRRKFEVVFVFPTASQKATYTEPNFDNTGSITTGGGEVFCEEWVRLPNDGQGENVAEIEEKIVRRLLKMHEGWIAGEQAMSPSEVRTAAAGWAGIPIVSGE